MPAGTGTSSVMRTVLSNTDELSFLTSSRPDSNLWPNTYASIHSQSPLARPQGKLSDTIEQLFENITISMLSEQSLQYVITTSQGFRH